jgi:hypothetical protein
MAISWPAKIRDKGGIRWEFHHVVDIVPNPFNVSFSTAAPDLIFLRLPQVDQECRDQIRDKWVAAPAATAHMPISMTAVAGIIPIKPERAYSCSRSEFPKAGRRHSRLGRSLAKMRVPEVSRKRYVYLNILKLLQSWRICIVSKFK